MKYLDELKNRSVFLWHGLFAPQKSGAADMPVYIDRAPLPEGAALPKEAAEETAAQSDGLTLPQTPQPVRAVPGPETAGEDGTTRTEERSEQTLSGVDAAAQLLEALRETPVQSGGVEETSTSPHLSQEEKRGAAFLWQQLRGTERSAARAAMPAEAPRETPTAPPLSAAGSTDRAADWSACFERDARRYDGTQILY